MVTHSFINLATQNVAAARAFFSAIGFEIDDRYSNQYSFCVNINPTTFLMIMAPDKFQGFSQAAIPNSFKQTEVIISFELESQAKVDRLLTDVITAKGTEFGKATDSEFMYYRSFRDLDGHHFEAFYYKKS